MLRHRWPPLRPGSRRLELRRGRQQPRTIT